MFDLSQVPAHLPEPLQALRGVEVKLQVPVVQDSQFPSHLLSQQCPSTHELLLHWLAAVQIEPFGRDVGASGPSFRSGASGVEVVPPVALGASSDDTPPEPPAMPPPPAPPEAEPSVGPPTPPAPPLPCAPSTGPPPASNPAFPSTSGDTYWSALPPSRPIEPRTQCP